MIGCIYQACTCVDTGQNGAGNRRHLKPPRVRASHVGKANVVVHVFYTKGFVYVYIDLSGLVHHLLTRLLEAQSRVLCLYL